MTMYAPDLIDRLQTESLDAAVRGDLVTANALDNAVASMLYQNKIASTPLNARAAWRTGFLAAPALTSASLEW